MSKLMTRATAMIALVVLLSTLVPMALAAETYTGTVNKDKVFSPVRIPTAFTTLS